MLSFRLYWVVSLISSSFLLSEKLPLNISAEIYPTEISLKLGRLKSKTNFSQLQTKSQTNLTYVNLLAKFLNIDWSSKRTKSTITKSSIASSINKKKTQPRFCSATKQISTNQDSVKKSQILAVVSVTQPKIKNKKLIPNTILQSLQNVFKLPNFTHQTSSSNSIPVALVRRKTHKYEVWVNNRLIVRLPSKQQASFIKKRLISLLEISDLNASKLKPAVVDGLPAMILGNKFIFSIQDKVSKKLKRSGDLLVIEWTNNLRRALKAPQLSLAEAQIKMYGLTASNKKISGLASWYGPYFHGRLTANGEKFNQNELTVAHKTLPFNTYLKITNLKTHKSVVVRVNARGPFIHPRSLDLSLVAASCIGGKVAGIIPYRATIMNKNKSAMTLKNPNFVTINPEPMKKLAIISQP